MTDPLHARLKRWAAAREADPARLDALARCIHGALPGPAFHAAPPAFPLHRKLGYALAGGLAVLAGLACLQALYREKAAPPPVAQTRPHPPAAAERAVPLEALFGEVSRLFPRQLRWVTQSNGEVGLGVESDLARPVPQTAPLMVRLVILSRRGAEAAWTEVWAADTVLHAEDMVEVAPSRHSENRLQFWILPLENGKVAVETDVRLEQPFKIASRINTVLGLGARSEVASFQNGDVQYVVLQVVEPIPPQEGAPS